MYSNSVELCIRKEYMYGQQILLLFNLSYVAAFVRVTVLFLRGTKFSTVIYINVRPLNT